MYDPNIEPAKDDVLFRSWDSDVLGVVEGMFREVYGDLKGKEKVEKERARRPQGVDGVDFDILLAKKPTLAAAAPVAEELVEDGGVGNSKIVEGDTDGFADPGLDLYYGVIPPLERNHNHQVAGTSSAVHYTLGGGGGKGVGENMQHGHGGSLLPIASSSPDRGRRIEQAPTVGWARGGVDGGFMTATEFMTAAGGDKDEYPQPGGGVGCSGTGPSPIKATSNYLQKFAGVDGPGGVIVRSNGRRERAVHRAREEGNLWPNPLERHPFLQGVGEQSESDESEEGENMDGSLGGDGSPVVKRRRVEMGKGKEKAGGSCGGGEDESDDEIPERDEQLDILFTQPLPMKQQQKKSAPRMLGQRKFVPPLLKPRGGEVAGVVSNEVAGSSGDDENMIDNNAPQSPPQQLPTRSPHRNRQRTATAALGMAVDTVVNNLTQRSALPGPTTTTAPTSEEEPKQPQPKPRKSGTKSRHLLPLERVALEERVHNTSVTVHFSSGVGTVERVVRGVGGLNRGEYTAGPKRSLYVREEMKGEWVGEVVREWLREKIGEEGKDWQRELVERVKWEEREGGGEGEEEIRRLVAVWV